MSEPVCLGIDPGSAHPAWGVVGGRCRPDVRGFGMLDVEHPAEALEALIWAYAPSVVAIETISAVHCVRRRNKAGAIVAGISTDQALALYRMGRLTGKLEGRLAAAGLPCGMDQFTAEEWRTAIIGQRQPDDGKIERILRLRLPGFPGVRKSNTHQRDALGAAFYGLLRFCARPMEKA